MELKEKLYKPSQAIIVHRSGNDYYLESCKINDDLSFGASHPLMKQTIIDIMETMSVSVTDRLQFKGAIPKNIITVRNTPGDTLIAWITKPQKVKMYFTKSVGLEDMIAPVSAMLWVAKNNSLRVFALKSNRINLKSKDALFIAPFPNVSGNGSVCWGSGKWPKGSEYYEDFIKQIELGFWESRFSHNMKNDLTKSKTDLHKLWESLKDKDVFPTDQLLISDVDVKKQLGL